MPITGQDLIVTRTALADARIVPADFPDTPPTAPVCCAWTVSR